MTNRPYLYSDFWTKQGAEIVCCFAGRNLRSLTMARKPFISIIYFYGLKYGPKGEHPRLYTDRADTAISIGLYEPPGSLDAMQPAHHTAPFSVSGR
jgi:hypothetical protein